MGVEESSRFNTLMTMLNLGVLGFVVLVGWTTGSVKIHENLMTPSFFPEGLDGVGRAAGLVFFSYLGFDMVSCLSEEVINPEKNMPIGIVGSLVASATVYFVVSLTVVGMAPIALLGEDVPIVNALLANACCTHDEQLDDIAAHPDSDYTCLSYSSCAASESNDHVSSFVFWLLLGGSKAVSCGAIFGLTTATFACLMGQPRIFYSMAQDGLLFKIYGQVNPKTGVPIVGTIMTGISTAIVACFIDLESLANVISLGTLQVFTFVNAGVIILRMSPSLTPVPEEKEEEKIEDNIPTERSALLSSNNSEHASHQACCRRRSSLLPDEGGAILVKESCRDSNHNFFCLHNSNIETNLTTNLRSVEQNGSKPHLLTLTFTICAVMASMGISRSWPLSLMIVMVIIVVLSVNSLSRLPQSAPPGTFSCPYVPWIPLLGIFCNSYMMGSMPLSTWCVIAVWLLAGICFYFTYGMHHSELRKAKL